MRPHEPPSDGDFFSVNISAVIKHYKHFLIICSSSYLFITGIQVTFIQKAKGCVRSLFSFFSQMPELLKEMLKEIILLKAVNSWRLWHSVHHCCCGLSPCSLVSGAVRSPHSLATLRGPGREGTNCCGFYWHRFLILCPLC